MALPPKAMATECYADTGAVAIFVQKEPFDLNKQHGVSSVAKVMKNQPSIIKLGVVDGDRARTLQNPFFKEFVKKDEWSDELIRLEHPVTGQELIVIEPAIESSEIL